MNLQTGHFLIIFWGIVVGLFTVALVRYLHLSGGKIFFFFEVHNWGSIVRIFAAQIILLPLHKCMSSINTLEHRNETNGEGRASISLQNKSVNGRVVNELKHFIEYFHLQFASWWLSTDHSRVKSKLENSVVVISIKRDYLSSCAPRKCIIPEIRKHQSQTGYFSHFDLFS